MAQLDSIGVILGALGPLATAILGVIVKRSEGRKQRQLAEVKDELRPDGGASLRDVVDRIERSLSGLTDTVAANQVRIEQLESERIARRRKWRL